MKKALLVFALIAGTAAPSHATTDWVDCSGTSWNPAFRDIDPTNSDPDHTGTEVRVYGWVFCVEQEGGQVVVDVTTQLERRMDFADWHHVEFSEPCAWQGTPSARANSGTNCNETPDYYPCPVADSLETWRTVTHGEGKSPQGMYGGSIGDEFRDEHSDYSNSIVFRCRPWVSSPPSP